MYKVIVVDDENAIRERLVNLVTNYFGDVFEVVGNYDNGYDALLNGAILKPDIMLTDLRMPYIDGLELIRRMKMEHPLIQTIIISGFDVFDYAKEAISLGVLGYLSKPVSADELKENLLKAKKVLDRRIEITESSKLKINMTDALKLVQSEDLNKLITLSSYSSDFLTKLKDDGIDINYRHLLFGAIDFDKENSELSNDDIERSFVYLDDYIKEEFKETSINTIFFKTQQYYILLLLSDNSFERESVHMKISSILANALESLNNSFSISFVEGKQKEGFFDFKKLYKRAIRTLDYRAVVGENVILFYDDINKTKNTNQKFDDSNLKNISYEILYGTKDNAISLLKEFLNVIISDSYKDNYIYILNKLVLNLLDNCLNLSDLFTIYGNYLNLIDTLFSLKTTESIEKFLCDLVEEVFEINQKSKQSGVDQSFSQIKDFIENNYNDSLLSLENVADELGYSVSYISAILKKNSTSFTKILTDLRMKKAIELLANPVNKLAMIANNIGYEDPFYFSHVFKKYYKMSPIEYRKNEKTNN